jgi:putative oxidoreductase
MNMTDEERRDATLLVARTLLVLLFLVFGWQKLTGFEATTSYFQHLGLPLPAVATGIALIVELIFGIAVVLGLFTRPLAIVMALYTLATALIGHRYWTMSGTEQLENEINFYKNVSIAAGFLELYILGPGKYSLEVLFRPQHATSD